MSLTLYSYFRSSAAYRVRIALNLKGLAYDVRPVHLLKNGGEHRKAAYLGLNPQGLVPTLLDGDTVLTQSIAILEYLEEKHPEPPLLPRAPEARARVRALAQVVASDIHPINNLRILKHLEHPLGRDDAARTAWYRHWIVEGFKALETLLAGTPGNGDFCWGDAPGMADACLIPQVFNARRYDVDLSSFPAIRRVDAACSERSAFTDAAPENQPDAE